MILYPFNKYLTLFQNAHFHESDLRFSQLSWIHDFVLQFMFHLSFLSGLLSVALSSCFYLSLIGLLVFVRQFIILDSLYLSRFLWAALSSGFSFQTDCLGCFQLPSISFSFFIPFIANCVRLTFLVHNCMQLILSWSL